MCTLPIRSGAATSPIFGRKENGITWLSSSICALGGCGLGTVGKAGRRTGGQGAGYGLRAAWQTFGPAIPLGSRVAIYKPVISPTVVAIPHTPEYESPGKLLGQYTDRASVPEFENRMDTDRRLQNCAGSPARHQPFFDASVQLDSASPIQRWAGAGSGRGKT